MISLPPDITFEKRPLPGGNGLTSSATAPWVRSGASCCRACPEAATHISCEVAGDPADPRTAERRVIFEPLGLEIARQMEQIVGSPTDKRPIVPPAPPVEPGEVVESKLMQCSTCNAFVAMLVFAPGATDTGRFEDYARRMYPEYSRRDLPTWIIGPASGPGPEDSADILQVWPTRKPLQRLTPAQFNPRLDRLAGSHCRPRKNNRR